MRNVARVLCFGRDPLLLETRRAVLAKHFDVTPVESLAALRRISYSRSFHLAVLCHSLSGSEYRETVKFLRRCCPQVGIVALTAVDPERALEDADCRLPGLDGPQALIGAVRSRLRERSLFIVKLQAMRQDTVLAHR